MQKSNFDLDLNVIKLSQLKVEAPVVLFCLEVRESEKLKEVFQTPLKCCSSSINKTTSDEGKV